MTDDKQRIEFAKWLFERTIGWIGTADVKVGVAMALDTALLGGLATAFGASPVELRTSWTYLWVLVSAGAFVLGVFCAGMAAVPRMLGPVNSMIFFARVKEHKIGDYVAKFSTLSEKDLLEDLVVQIHRNAEIANDKHAWVRKSLMWSFLGMIPWVIAIAMLVKV